VGDLETLEAIATFSFLSDDVKNGVNQFSTFSVMSLGPVVTSSGLSKDEVIWSEKLPEWSCTYGVHCAWLKIHQDSSGDVTTTSCLVEIDIDSLKLEIRISVVGSCWVNTVLVRNNFPEFSTDLVTTLSSLDMNDFSHF
jgi:hypothetical protein